MLKYNELILNFIFLKKMDKNKYKTYKKEKI